MWNHSSRFHRLKRHQEKAHNKKERKCESKTEFNTDEIRKHKKNCKQIYFICRFEFFN